MRGSVVCGKYPVHFRATLRAAARLARDALEGARHPIQAESHGNQVNAVAEPARRWRLDDAPLPRKQLREVSIAVSRVGALLYHVTFMFRHSSTWFS